MKKYFLFLAVIMLLSCSKHEPFPAVRSMLMRIIPDKQNTFIIDSIAKEDGKDVFEIESKDGKIILRGSSPVAVSSAFNYYLKHSCHCFISRSGNNMNLPEQLPVVNDKIRNNSPYQWRYYLNYCTYNYSMSWWTWEDWEREIDWMAMNGINMPLAIIGMEKVWQNTLLKFKFTDEETKQFICGPAYTAWWLMGNLEGWGGPVSQKWIDSRVELEQKILARMRELGMTPVFHGFYCMVPVKLKEKYPDHNIIYGGKWAVGFERPSTLVPTDSLFAEMAAVYYEEMEKLYGKTLFYGGDPFHEGGNTEGVDITASAKAIQTAMQKAVPGSIWVLQGWWDNPTDKLLAGIDSGKAMILDLFADGRPNWSRRDCYLHYPWTWSMLQNFGNKTGMYGRLEMATSEPVRALKSEKGKTLQGIGTMPEGIDNNPVMWDALFDMSWKNEAPDMGKWINEYALYRYGKSNEKIQQAWNILMKGIYRGPLNQEGTKDAIICARPSLISDHAWIWHKIVYYYDTIDLQKAWKLMIDCSDEFKNNDSYQFDLVDITRQVLCDKAQDVHIQLSDACRKKDMKRFEEKSVSFLTLMEDLDRLLGTRKEFLLGRWLEESKKCAATDEEKKLFEWNARTIITVWGNKECSELCLHEYAMKQWSGLIKDFYCQRWKMYFEVLTNRLKGNIAEDIDFYTWENNWTHRQNIYPDKPRGDAVEISKELFKKYINPEALKPFGEKIVKSGDVKIDKDYIINSLAFDNSIKGYMFRSEEIKKLDILKETRSGDQSTIECFIETSDSWKWKGKVILHFKWNIYEWILDSGENIDFKELKK